MSVLPKSTLRKATASQKYGDKSSDFHSDNHALVMNSCMKILEHESPEEINKWLIENKITSTQLKNEKRLMVITHSLHVIKAMVVEQQMPQQFLNLIVKHYKSNNKKSYQFCRLLKHFSYQDYEFDYLLAIAKGEVEEPVSFYLRCRAEIVDSFLNKQKKQFMSIVFTSSDQWFKPLKKIFKNTPETELVDIYTETCRAHYLQIKKNSNEDLSGDEFFKVCLIIRREASGAKEQEQSYADENYYVIEPGNQTQQFRYEPNNKSQKEERIGKQKSVKRLLDRSVINNLESEDRELIRMLSYKDTNIARLLEKKHEKMIDTIIDEVQDMRTNIDAEKKKYIELHKQKEQIMDYTDKISHLALLFVEESTFENQNKLLQAIEGFSNKYHKNPQHTVKAVERAKEGKKNQRLIEIIEKEEREVD